MNKDITAPVIDPSLTDMVWLDLDDTLIDFRTNSRRALSRLYDERNLARYFDNRDRWIETYERHNHILWSDYAAGSIDQPTLRMERFRRPLTDGGASQSDARHLSEEFDTLYLDFLAQETKLVDGCMDLLIRIRKAGLPIGILSNGFTEVQHRKIRNCGLLPYIDIIVLSDDIGVNKPDVRLYRHAMRRSGFEVPERHLMIGDNPYTDIAGALDAGWQAILLMPGYVPEQMPRCAVAPALDDIKVAPKPQNG